MISKTTSREIVAKHAAIVRDGLKDAIRREVERRRRLGLPIVVQLDGEVVDLQEVERSAKRDQPS